MVSVHWKEYGTLILSASLVNNVVMVRILGLCPFLGLSKRMDSAFGIGMATSFVLTLGCGMSYLIYHYLLMPYHLIFLRTLTFILIIAAIVQLTEIVMHKTSPVLYQLLGIYLPLITTNCAVLGVPLIAIQHYDHFLSALLFGFSSSLGFALILGIFSALRERLEAASIPQSLAGTPIALITAGIMSLAFMGFQGLVPPL